MDFELFNFVVNNIIKYDKISSIHLIKIIYLYKKYNKKLSYDISYVNIDLDHLHMIINDKSINNIQDYIYNPNKIIDNITYLYSDYLINKHLNYNIFTNLKVLNFINDRIISNNHIKNLYNLEELILPKNKIITDIGLINLNNLKIINLKHNTNITNNSLINKTKLEKLTLVYNKNINDEAFTNIKNLTYLNLGYNNNRKLKLYFLKNNLNLREIILYKKKNIDNDILEIINNIKKISIYQLNIIN